MSADKEKEDDLLKADTGDLGEKVDFGGGPPIEVEVESDTMTDGPFCRLRIAGTDDYIGWMRPDAAEKLHAALGEFLLSKRGDGTKED